MKGTVTDLPMYAGEGVTNIKDIRTVNELLLRLWKEYGKSKAAANRTL
jgi:hypothetical protein